ncbi:hypothetical protein J2X46_000369 [Nocardioides sp. BE266]|uniref:hypothetical protein n=1 Tax=Nocardioides sp. BE266 TaxID=2817725 RepID=UPI002860C103|nr:hypothetical protein [Nocardioides sp. BE266]MDR7251397.1 hypothetical protein [Nocardioides sp. BE266]
MSTPATVAPEATPPLPTSIKVLAWTSLGSTLVPLLDQGIKDDTVSLVGSVVIFAPLMGFVAAGVVRARTGRLVLAWAVLSLSFLFGALGLFTSDSADDRAVTAFSVVFTAVSLVALERFSRTEWYAWQRTKPSKKAGASIRGLVAIGVLVGALGGISAPPPELADMRVNAVER